MCGTNIINESCIASNTSMPASDQLTDYRIAFDKNRRPYFIQNNESIDDELMVTLLYLYYDAQDTVRIYRDLKPEMLLRTRGVEKPQKKEHYKIDKTFDGLSL